jgi:hypothetical protein
VKGRGRQWEQPATVSYFDRGQLLFASGAGIRVHGGLSRDVSPVKSFKLYFRRDYGTREFGPGLIFDRSAEPLRRLILSNDLRIDGHGRYWHFVNPLAYDISARIGAKVPQTKPARFFLNGDLLGVYVLTENIDTNIHPAYLDAHYGHEDFATTNREFDALWRWLQQREPWTMETVAEIVDIDNLTRWFLSILFCGTEDSFQGAQLRDRSDPNGKWFWINWDMDHSFMDYNLQADRPWQHDTFRVVFERIGEPRRGRREYEVRSAVLTALISYDEPYRQFFKKVFVDAMNYRLTREFLDERYRFYERIAREYQVEHLEYLDVLREFLDNRPAFLRRLTEQYLNSEPSTKLTLRGPEGVRFVVDGFAVPNGFSGYYFPDMTIEISATDRAGAPLVSWRVDGRPTTAPGGTLAIPMNLDVVVEAG